MNRVLVTGASGLVGSALVQRLAGEPGVQVIAGVRKATGEVHGVEQLLIDDLAAGQVDARQLSGIEVLVHAAARVHVMRESEADPLAAFRQVNVEGTRALLVAARQAGVRRFVLVSSIKVNGECTLPGRAFCEADAASAQDAYALSKWEAEQLVQAFCEAHGMEWVIVRPPLVYGAGVRANFSSFVRMLALGLPLPLGALHNRRSLVSLVNLVDFLTCCACHPLAANQLFLIRDDEELSVTQLSRKLVGLLGARSILVPLPSVLLRVALCSLGRSAVASRLCGELRVDSSKARILLNWKAPQHVDEALSVVAQGFLEEKKR